MGWETLNNKILTDILTTCRSRSALFLVGALSDKNVRLLQCLVFLFFCCQTTELILCVKLFSTDFIRFNGIPAVAGLSLCFSQKLFRKFANPDESEGSPCQFFSALCDFFPNFFCLPFNFLIINWSFKKTKGSPFYIFWHYEAVSKF